MAENKPTLAQRREALVALCSVQRAEMAQEKSMMFAPVLHGGGGIMSMLQGRSWKVPLTIAGVVLGMVAVRPTRFVPLITTALSLWKIAQPALQLLRRPGAQKF